MDPFFSWQIGVCVSASSSEAGMKVLKAASVWTTNSNSKVNVMIRIEESAYVALDFQSEIYLYLVLTSCP